ncbi:hypothetical protein ACHAXR_000484 [Thalassiosira sp. AJA248-18]
MWLTSGNEGVASISTAIDIGASASCEITLDCQPSLFTRRKYGYFPEPDKCYYICKAEDEQVAKKRLLSNMV